MEEKKVKMSLGTAICIFIIVILIAALIGMYIYFNKNAKNNEVADSNGKVETYKLEDIAGTFMFKENDRRRFNITIDKSRKG